MQNTVTTVVVHSSICNKPGSEKTSFMLSLAINSCVGHPLDY